MWEESCSLKRTGFTPLCAVCWEGFPLLNVNKYINTLWTTEHQCRGKWGFYLSKATLKYIEDFISPFWWGGVLFATVLSRCLRHAAFARNTRDVNLNSAHRFLAETPASLVPAHASRWRARPSFPLWIFVLLAHMSACVRLWHGHLTKLSFFFPLADEFSLIHLIRGDKRSVAGPAPLYQPLQTVVYCGAALTFQEYRVVLTSPARPLFSQTSCGETSWIEQQHTIVSLTGGPLSQSQNKCEIRRGELWQLKRLWLASMLPVSLSHFSPPPKVRTLRNKA